jgi:hypothetical protein
MPLTVELPIEAESLFRRAWGDELDRTAFEALLVEGYRTGRLTRYEVQQLLGFDNRWDAEAWLGQHGAVLSYDQADLDADRATLARVTNANP